MRDHEERLKRKQESDVTGMDDRKVDEALVSLKRKRSDSVADQKHLVSMVTQSTDRTVGLHVRPPVQSVVNSVGTHGGPDYVLKLRRQKVNNSYCLCEKGTDSEDGSMFWVCEGPRRDCPCNGYVHKKCFPNHNPESDSYLCPYCVVKNL